MHFDENLKRQSAAIAKKLGILHEKKIGIEKYINQCEQDQANQGIYIRIGFLSFLSGSLGSGRANERRTSNSNALSAATNAPILTSTEMLFNENVDIRLFDHYYVIHNINLLWKKDVRNTLFKLFDLQSKNMAVKYFMTNDSNRIVKELVNTLAEKVSNPKNLVRDERPDSPTNKYATETAYEKTVGFDKHMADDLLGSLIEDSSTDFFVPNETETDFEAEERNHVKKQGRFAISKEFTYCASKNPQSPDFVPRGYCANSQSVLLMINPQINLEAEHGEDGHLQSVVVAAENMELQSVNIVDRSMMNNNHSELGDYVSKFRTILKVHNAQFFVSRSGILSFSHFAFSS